MQDLNITCKVTPTRGMQALHLLLCLPCIQKVAYSFSSVDTEAERYNTAPKKKNSITAKPE